MTPRPHHPSTLPSPGTQVPMKRIVVSFSIAVVMVVAAVLYYTLQRAIVTLELEPASEVAESTLTVGVKDSGASLTGTVAALELSGSKKFPASPSGVRDDKASGTVTLSNNQTTAQTLIATTRLLSPDKVLFRLRQTVSIPARGKLEQVAVIADQAGEASAIGPTKFTIPGLRANLQDKVYAESTEPMRRAEKPGSKVTAVDLDDARKSLTELLVPQALAKLREQLPAAERSWTVVYKSETPKAESSVPAGTTATEFTYSVTVKVVAVFYDPQVLRDRVLAESQADLSSGRKILSIEEQSLAVGVGATSVEEKTASLTVKFLAKVSITDAERAFSKADLLGRTAEEVQNYFASVPGVRNAQVEMSPFWVNTVPTVESHITIEIKE